MKPTFNSSLWPWGIFALTLLFIVWCASLISSMKRHQAEIGLNVALINRFIAVEQSIRELEKEFYRETADVDSAAAQWQRLTSNYHFTARSLDTAAIASYGLGASLSRIDSGVSRLDSLRLKVFLLKPRAVETKTLELEFRREMNFAIDEVKNAVQKIRARQWEVSTILAQKSDGLNRLVIVSCALAVFPGLMLLLYQRDSVKRKKAEEALRENEERYRAVAETATDAIITIDRQSRILFANRATEKIFGYTVAEALGQPITILMPEKSRQTHQTSLQRYLDTGQKHLNWEAAELVGRHKSGQEIPLEISFGEVEKNDRHVFTAIVRDITARKKVELALRESEARFHNMADTAPVMLWMSGPDKLCTYVSKGWLEFTGREIEQELNNGWTENIHAGDLPRCLEIYHTALETRREFQMEYRYKRRDGVYRWLLNTGIPRSLPDGSFIGYIGSCVDITEHRQAEDSLRESEEALRQSEERYRTLIERLTDGVYRSTPEGKFIEANPAMVKMLGYAGKEELMAIDIKKQLYFDEQEREIVVDKLRQAGSDEIDVFRLRRKDGHEVWVEDHGQLVYDAAGKVIYHEGILRNITARKHTEEALRESEERYRSVIGALAEGVVLHDADGGIIACNASAERTLGLSMEQLQGRTSADPIWQAIHEDGTPFSGETHPAMISLRTGQSCSNVVMGIHKPSGELTWISMNSQPLLRANANKPYAVVASFYDITERKWAEEALRESEERYRLLAENSLDLIGLLDLDGNVMYASPSHYYLIGYTPNELVHQNLFAVVHADDVPRALAAINSLLAAGARKTIEWRMLKKSGDWIEMEAILSGIPGPGNAIHRILFTARDITVRKQVEERIKASLKEKEVLLKEIHHRVKNNLQIISSLLNLQSGYIQDKHAGEMFKESRNRVRSMALIHEKLYQSKDLARIDFAEYVRHLTTHLFRSYGVNSHAVGLKINVDKVLLDIDTAIPCGLIVNELVSNSLKYAFPPGVAGEICVDLHRENDGTLALLVSDNGAGLPPDFDVRQTESLGLQLVSTLADQLAGTITLDHNGGTTFKILLHPHNGFDAREASDGVQNSGIDLPF